MPAPLAATGDMGYRSRWAGRGGRGSVGTPSQMRINIDTDRCQGHGRCYTTAPDLFTAADDFGRAGLMGPDVVDPASSIGELARRASAGCPERAISLSEEDDYVR